MPEFEGGITCRGIVGLVTDYLEGALPPNVVRLFDEHLETCEGCQRYLEQMRITVATVGRIRGDDMPAEMRERLLATFRELREQ